MSTIGRIVVGIVGLALIAFAAADFVLSGNKFTWPPPQQISLAALQADLTNLVSAKPSAPTPPAPAPKPAPKPTTTASNPPPPPSTPSPQPATPPADNSTPPASPPASPPAPDQNTPADNTTPVTSPSPPPPTPPSCDDEIAGTTAVAFVPGVSAWYCPPGTMLPARGKGDVDNTDNAPGIRYPLELAPSYPNSQIWGTGGYIGPKPDSPQGDPPNYQYPWHDDFCETRGYATQQCPGGKGHQGQDIRPAMAYDPKITTKKKLYQDHFYVVAVENGYISHVGTYMVTLYGDSGTKYDYLHMDFTPPNLLVKAGDTVKRGQPLGYLSNNFGTSATTFHLHFQIRRPVKSGESGDGDSAFIYMSPYMALVNSYTRLLKNQEPPFPGEKPPANP